MDSNSNQIEEIKNKIDIVSIVGKYVKLRQAGKNYSGLCPFHNEKTPSFIVSPDLQRYKCFGCGETGDIYNFIQKVENIDFPEALERLAKEAGVEIKKTETSYKYKTLEEINYNATKYYYKELKNNKIAQKYLAERGFKKESIKTFGIGYSPRNSSLLPYLSKIKRYTRKELLDSGLFTLKGNTVKEKFFNRIMFPIRSRRGTVLGFTARVLPGDDWGPKYMNSPDTPIFHKKDNVFGQYESRQEIRKDDLVIICEGSTDVVSAHQYGIKNIVAPLGTALTTEQLTNLSILTKNLLFFFDSDEAGKNALVRAFKIASELKLNPYATSAKPYKDIDELLQKEPEKIKALIKNKTEAFSFILTDFLSDKDINKLSDLDKIKTFIGSLLSSVKDNTTKQHYIKKVFNITKINVEENVTTFSSSGKRPVEANSVLVKKPDNKLEGKYIKLLLLLNSIKEESLIPNKHITSKPLLDIYSHIVKSKDSKKEVLYSTLKNDSDINTVFEDLIFDLNDMPTTQEEVIGELKIVKKRLESAYLKNKQKELSVKIAIAEENNNYKDSEKYFKELTEVNKILKETDND